MKRSLLVAVLFAALTTSFVAPSINQPVHASQTASQVVHSHPAAFDKTRFLLHIGFAYFAFHHFVWKAYKDGKFTSGNRFIRAIRYVKAGIALLFAYHEGKVAYDIAVNSKSKTLQIIIAPMKKLIDAFQAIGNKMKHGSFSSSDMTSLNTQTDSFQKLAKSSNGLDIQDKTTSVPGA